MTIQFIASTTEPLPDIRQSVAAEPQEQDLRWLPESFEERQVIAHCRGWAHLGTSCHICRVEAHDADVSATLKSIITGSR